MAERKKTPAAERPAGKKAPPKKAPPPQPPVEAYGNVWRGCLPLTEEQLVAAERELGVSVPGDLRALFLRCNGGRPERQHYASARILVDLGWVLPVGQPPVPRRESFETVVRRAAKYALPPSTVPFAFDTGNAGVFCVDASGRVVYWVHDEPEDPIKDVAPSLNEFLTHLTVDAF